METVFFGLKDWERSHLKNRLAKDDIGDVPDFIDGPLNKDNLPKRRDFKIVSVFVGSEVDKEVLDAFGNLEFITTRSTGFDHIDLEECAKRGIVVSNVPTYGEHTVAEYTFGLILALLRKICLAYNKVREEGGFNQKGLQGSDLKGKTLGVVGVGSIGSHVVEIAKGFKMNILGYDRTPEEDFACKLGFKHESLDEVLSKSDIVTLHVPYNKGTHHLINKESIFKMKKGSYLINTSRGAVVETEALVSALESGHLAGAAVDVLEEEGVIKDELRFLLNGDSGEHDLKAILAGHVLIDMLNVIVTPHNASNSKEALGRILDITIDNIQAFVGGSPINLVKIR